MLRKLLICALLLSGCQAGRQSATTGVETHEHEHAQEEHKHKEGVFELSPEQLQKVGVKIAPVGYAKIVPQVNTTGTVTGDPDLEVKVSARVAGIVRSLEARVGDAVVPGQLLAVIDSPEVSQNKATYHNAQLERELAEKNVARRAELARLGDTTRAPLEDAQKEVIKATAELEAARAADHLAQTHFKRLQGLLADGIASGHQVDEARAKALETAAKRKESEAELALAQSHLQRETRIRRSGLLVQGEVWEAESQRERAEHTAQHSREQLEVLGADPDADDASVRLYAPIRGLVTERKVARGERAEIGEDLFSLLDTSRLWVWIDLTEQDARLVQVGTPVRLWPTGQPENALSARISYLSPTVDPTSRTLRARVEVANPHGRFRPNMFVSVAVEGKIARHTLVIPPGALAEVEGKSVVYVQQDDHHFERRTVRLGAETRDGVEVLSGLKSGERIAVDGVFSLKSEDMKDELEQGHSH